MKIARIWVLLGVMSSGLIYGPVLLSAQPANAPVSTNSQPTPVAGAILSDADESLSTDDSGEPWNKGVSIEIRSAARELFLEGNRLFRIPLFLKATEKYTAALSKWKHPGIYFNLAIAQLNSGQEIEAYANLEHALKQGQKSLDTGRLQEAERQLQELRRQLGRIRITCRTQRAQVTLDGVHLFTGPGSYEGWAKAKDHEITAKNPEYLSEARRVTIVPGQFHDIELKLVTLSEATDASRRWAAWKPRAVTALGGAVLAAGGVLHALAVRKFNAYDREFQRLPCAKKDSPDCLEDGPDLLGRPDLNAQLELARKEWSAAVGAYIVGSSLLTTGIVLLYLNRPRLVGQRVERAPSQNVEVMPTLSNDMFGILVNMSH